MEGAPHWVEVLVIVAAALGALAVIWRKGLLPVVKFFRAVDRIAEAMPVLIEIADEFKPNGGASLRDSFDRIEVSMVEGRAVAVEERAAMTTSLERIGRQLDEHLALPSWASERGEVLPRLAAVIERQAFVIATIVEVLREADNPIAVEIVARLERALVMAEEEHLRREVTE